LSDDALDRNLAALLTRALPDDAPSEAFRRRVALTVAARLPAVVIAFRGARRGAAESTPRTVHGTRRPLAPFRGLTGAVIGALAAAALLVFVFQGALFEGAPRRPAEGPNAAPHGTHGPWVARGTGTGPLAPQALLGALASALAHANEPTGLAWSALPAGAAAFAVEVGRAAAVAPSGAWVAAPSAPPRGTTQRVPVETDASTPRAGLVPATSAAEPEPPSVAPTAPGAPRLWVRVLAADGGAAVARFRAWVKREVFVPEVAQPDFSDVETPTGLVALTVSERGSQTLVIEAAGFAPWRATGLRVNTADNPVVVALERGVPLVGSVQGAATSAPIAGVLVYIESALPHDVVELHARDLAPLPLHAATTDTAGAFRIEHAPRGEVVLRASHPDFAPAWSVTLDLAGAALDAPRATQVPSIALEPGGTVVGRVEKNDGSPFEGAEIVLSTLTNRAVVSAATNPGVAPARVMTYGAATTDSDGTYRVEHLPAGRFVALNMGDVAAGAALPRMLQTIVTAGETVRVDFLVDGARSAGEADGPAGARRTTDHASLVGRLRDADLAPCADVDLSLFEVHSGAWRAARTDVAGRFEFQGVPPGFWAICRATRGFENQQVLRHVEVAPEIRGTLDVDVTLSRGALVFVAQQGDGRPVTSGRLALKREVAPSRFEFHAVLALHESGRTRVDGLPDGRYRATLIGDTLGLGHVQVGPLVLSGELEVSERCTLPRGGALELRVRDELGGPVPAYVLVSDAAGNELLLGLDPRTDAGGVRHIPCLAPGSYTLEVQAFDGRSRSVSCETREGETTELTVELPTR
jgi:hypothetical protein